MAPNKLTLAFAAGSILLSQLLSYGPVLAETSQLIKVQDNSAVYLVSGTQRHAFPLLNIYKSWFGLTFESVKTVSAAELASYMLGKNVLFKKGSLIKIQTDPKVYQVLTDDGALEWIPTEEEFKKRGLSFADVKDVPDSLFSDYRHAVASDFATPQNMQSEKPTSPNTSTLGTTKPSVTELSILDVIATSYATTDGQSEAHIKFSTSMPAAVKLSYGPSELEMKTLMLDSAQTFTKKFPVSSGVTYQFLLSATAADGSTATYTNKFVSYADIIISPISGLVPTGTLVTQSEVLVGGFLIRNDSLASRTSNLIVLQFDSSSNVTTQVAKSINIVRLNENNSFNSTMAQKNVSRGVNMINASGAQKIGLEIVVAPGEVQKYGIVLKNIDQINKDFVSPSDTFAPRISRIDFLGETSINLDTNPLATLFYVK
jgi:hypothetical protein